MSAKNVKWEWKKLGNLYSIKMGKTPPRADKSCWDTSKKTHNVWVSIADISANEDGFIYDTKEYISDKSAQTINKVEQGSLLLSFKLSIGKMAFAGVPLYTNEAIASFPPKSIIFLPYLHKYFLYFDWDKASEGDAKVKGKTLNKEKLKNIDVLVPPIDEQKRIVNVLDETFEKIEKIKANAQTNLQNAKDLFQITLAQELTITEEKIKQGWEEKNLDDCCEITSVLVDPKETKYRKLLHVGGANIESETGRLLDLQTAEEENLISGKFLFDDSMILYSKIRPYLKKIVQPDFSGLCSADIYPLSVKTNMNKGFLFYTLFSEPFTDFANKNSARAGMPKINRESLFAYKFFLPSLPIQKQIVAKLDSLSEKVKQLESNYKQILADCDELKKATLKKAFEGDL